MSREVPSRFDVLVVGGGPAGMAAAMRAAESGSRVGIVDDNMRLGGQIWRGEAVGAKTNEAGNWQSLLRKAGVTALSGLRVFDRPEAGVLWGEGADDLRELHYARLVLATGARELFLPFPGWTLPNVMGAGGLQAMVKCGLPIRGKRVVVAGTGPLLLAVAAYLGKQGAKIPVICEQAPMNRLVRFSLALLAHPSKLMEAARLKRELAGIPFAANSWPLAAHGNQRVESVTISRSGRSETISCDYLACGFHLVPNIELAQLLGCQIADGFVQVDQLQQTTMKGIFCAGEPTGIGGLELSLVEGQIAGFAAAGRAAEASRLFGQRARARRFARGLGPVFALRPELRRLSSPETLVCRCEDVSYGRLKKHDSWRAAKLQTRCGMGPCQGRICGSATQVLFGWSPDSVRPPIFPARVESLAAGVKRSELEQNAVSGGDR